MRRKIIALLLLTILLGTQNHLVIGAENYPLIELSRDVNIQKGGITSITDIITLKAPAGETRNIQSIWMGYQIEAELVQFELKQGNNWTPLIFESESRGNNSGYLVDLPSEQTITDTESIVIQAKYTYINLILQATPNIAYIPVYPIFEYNITSLSLSAQLPESSEYKSYEGPFNITNNNNTDGIWRFYYNSTNISDYVNITEGIAYTPSTGDKYVLYLESLEHSLKLNQNYVEVSQIYELRNAGNALQMFYVNIPSEASNIWAYDHVGSLFTSATTPVNSTGEQEVIVYSRGTIYRDNKWVFTLVYHLPYEGYIEGDTLSYTIGDYEYYVREVKASVIIPEGGEYLSGTPEPNSIVRDEETKINYIYGSRLPQKEDTLALSFTLSATSAWIRLLAAVFLSAGIIGGVVYLRRQKKPESITKIKIKSDIPEITRYVNKYKERLAVLKEYNELLNNPEEGKEAELAEINKQLGIKLRETKQEEKTLKDEDFNQELKSIKNAEKDIASIKNDLNSLETRLRTRRISKRDYERRIESRVKRLQQAIEVIEKALISLSK